MKQTLKQLREARGLTQQELAGELRVSISTITSIETRRHPPRFDTARKIAAFFQVAIGDIEWPEKSDPPKTKAA